MGERDRPPNCHIIAGKWRWIAPPKARARGAVSETLTQSPRLTVKAIERAIALNLQWRKEQRTTVAPDTLAALADRFQQSQDYAALSKSRRAGIDTMIRSLGPLGEIPVEDLTRADCVTWWEAIIRTRGVIVGVQSANLLRRILAYGVGLELRPDNPAARPGIKGGASLRRVRWTPAEVAAVIALAVELDRPRFALFVSLTYDGGQRPGDCAALPRSAFDGEGIALRQSKTGAEIWFPVSARSRDLIDATDGSWLTGAEDGEPRPSDPRAALGRVWERHVRPEAVARKLVREELQLRDLRRTAATEASAGGARPEPLTGHKPGSAVLRHYVMPDRQAVREVQAARQRGREQAGKGLKRGRSGLKR